MLQNSESSAKGPELTSVDLDTASKNPKKFLKRPATPHHTVFDSQDDYSRWCRIHGITDETDQTTILSILKADSIKLKLKGDSDPFLVKDEPELEHAVPDTSKQRKENTIKAQRRPATPHDSIFKNQGDFQVWCNQHDISYQTAPSRVVNILGIGAEGKKVIESMDSKEYDGHIGDRIFQPEDESEPGGNLNTRTCEHQISIETERDKKLAKINRDITRHEGKSTESWYSKGFCCCGKPVKSSVKSLKNMIKKSREEFQRSKSACALVDVLLETIDSGNKMTFDYVLLVCVASFLAALGLLSDSSVVVVASMLVSPIMGPLLAITFGLLCGQNNMVKRGIFNETVSIAMCIFIGIVTSCIAAPFHKELAYPTDEMIVRGNWNNFVVGIFVAFFSGIGVALSVAGHNTPCLVGVAISASLLPPAVNSGMFIGFKILTASGAVDMSNSESEEGSIMSYAGWSFALVLINCVLIVVTGIAIFKIKEIAPMEDKPIIFEYGLKAKRDENRRLRAESTKPGSGSKVQRHVHFADELDEIESQAETCSNSQPANSSSRNSSPKNSNSRLRRRQTCGTVNMYSFDEDDIPARTLRRHNSRCTVPDSFKAASDVLDWLPRESQFDLQHSLRTVPTSRFNFS